MVTASFLLSTILWVSRCQALEKFIAATYEHAVILPNQTTPLSPEEALDLMNKNIDVLEGAVKTAAQQGAHLIVTPEDGIYGYIFTRKTIAPFLEDIPDPNVNWIPCSDPKRFGRAPVQTRLSCIAKKYSIYVVANIGDKKLCNKTDVECPDDGHYNYNTAVVYDSNGKLVARYHKYNLYGEDQFNVPKKPELVSFETPFGKFGIFICYDILFYNPAIALVEEHKVDTILYPTAWINKLPYLSAIEFHSAWAMRMGVNLISANTHNTFLSMTGSGIFSPDKVVSYYYNMRNESGHLLIAELNSHPRNFSPYYPIKWNLYASQIDNSPSGSNVFSGYRFADAYTFTELKDLHGDYSICQNNLCCHVNYTMAEKHSDEMYVLGVYDGLHGHIKKYYLQVCTMLKCHSMDLRTCGEPVETASTRFDSFSISGTFSTSFVFPEVLLTGVQLAPDTFQVMKDGRLVSKSGISSQPLLSATLFGRWYEKDPPSE